MEDRVGWREWVALPELGVEWIKAKVDTGARSSSLHAFDMEFFELDADPWIRFQIHPWQESSLDPQPVEAPILEMRLVRSSSGEATERPTIATSVSLRGQVIPIELTLTRRDEMGFRMLLGREALRGRLLVDPGQSYLGGKPPKDIRERNRVNDEEE